MHSCPFGYVTESPNFSRNEKLQMAVAVESRESNDLNYSNAVKSATKSVNNTHQAATNKKPGENSKGTGGISQHAQRSIVICDEQENVSTSESDGFIGVKRARVNTKRFFLSGIAENVTREMILSYLSKREVNPTLLRIFSSRRKGTVSAKLNVRISDANTISKDNFWPKFVVCKPWLSKEKLSKDNAEKTKTNE